MPTILRNFCSIPGEDVLSLLSSCQVAPSVSVRSKVAETGKTRFSDGPINGRLSLSPPLAVHLHPVLQTFVNFTKCHFSRFTFSHCDDGDRDCNLRGFPPRCIVDCVSFSILLFVSRSPLQSESFLSGAWSLSWALAWGFARSSTVTAGHTPGRLWPCRDTLTTSRHLDIDSDADSRAFSCLILLHDFGPAPRFLKVGNFVARVTTHLAPPHSIKENGIGYKTSQCRNKSTGRAT